MRRIEAVYEYVDERGRVLFEVIRYNPKDFNVRRPDPNGGFIYDINGIRRVLYNLPSVLTATHIAICEGEKDTEVVQEAFDSFQQREGVRWAATTVAGGSKGWRLGKYAPYFAGKCAFILVDNDASGKAFGQEVARSITGFARRVKIVDLPELPPKGDVADYLDEHSAKELQTELREAPLYQQKLDPFVGGSNTFNPQLLREYFDAPDENQSWLVEGLLPSGGMSLLAGKPKDGKSTLARQLVLAVATGEPFLSRQTEPGEVLYLALEEKAQEVKNHFRDLGASGDEPIRIHCATAPIKAVQEARLLLQKHPASPLIIDPLFKFVRVKDGNDYAGMTAALEPILAMARETGTHVLCVHHAGKGERTHPGDEILGSTAILGNVDTAILLTRFDEYRTISTRQRYGQDLPQTVLDFDPTSRSTALGVPRQRAEQVKIERQFVEFLKSNPGALEADILEGVVGRKQKKVSALRGALKTQLRREGKGGKSDPFRYFVVPPSDASNDTVTRQNQTSSKPSENEEEIVVPDARMMKKTTNSPKPANPLVLAPVGGSRPGGRSRARKPKRSRWPNMLERFEMNRGRGVN